MLHDPGDRRNCTTPASLCTFGEALDAWLLTQPPRHPDDPAWLEWYVRMFAIPGAPRRVVVPIAEHVIAIRPEGPR
jgi:hypothetical protein